jgi:hypothetical protein
VGADVVSVKASNGALFVGLKTAPQPISGVYVTTLLSQAKRQRPEAHLEIALKGPDKGHPATGLQPSDDLSKKYIPDEATNP